MSSQDLLPGAEGAWFGSYNYRSGACFLWFLFFFASAKAHKSGFDVYCFFSTIQRVHQMHHRCVLSRPWAVQDPSLSLASKTPLLHTQAGEGWEKDLFAQKVSPLPASLPDPTHKSTYACQRSYVLDPEEIPAYSQGRSYVTLYSDTSFFSARLMALVSMYCTITTGFCVPPSYRGEEKRYSPLCPAVTPRGGDK